jgi:predicted enzyme related to lactoylglutathione lyase
LKKTSTIKHAGLTFAHKNTLTDALQRIRHKQKRTLYNLPQLQEAQVARVTGIGGIFLRARDPKALSAWYAKNLGIQLSDYGGATLLWSDEVPATTGMTTWSLFPEDTTYFGKGNEKGPQQAMVNYRVDDLDALLTQLAAEGVTIDPKREDADYGRFAWITDPEGNRLELWQPLVSPE